jgi:hypothetical protein
MISTRRQSSLSIHGMMPPKAEKALLSAELSEKKARVRLLARTRKNNSVYS